MEKFYIVTNEDFLKEIQDFNAHAEERRLLINEFFEKYGIVGNAYHISGDGFVNEPFEDIKTTIFLHIRHTTGNDVDVMLDGQINETVSDFLRVLCQCTD